jgi:hypothetical protein
MKTDKQKLAIALTLVECQRELICLTKKINVEIIHGETLMKYKRIERRIEEYTNLLKESYK